MKVSVKYQSINQRINQSIRYYRVPSEREKDAALNFLLEKIDRNAVPKTLPFSLPRWVYFTSAAAAVLVAAISLFWSLSTSSITNTGEQPVAFMLPDSSRVVLPEGSKISYPRHYQQNRNIKLQGEGYFEVRKGNTFRVMTRNGRIEALGTRFTVRRSDEGLEVFCYEGKVKTEFGKKEEIVEAGSGISFSGRNNPKTTALAEAYPGFARFRKSYTHVPLETVFHDIEAFFGIRVEDQSGRKRFFSGSIDSGNVETILAIVTGSLQLNYEFQGDSRVLIFVSQ